MITTSLGELARIVGGELVESADVGRWVNAVTTKPEEVVSGALFVPAPTRTQRLYGIDLHQSIPDVVQRGGMYLAGVGYFGARPPSGVIVADPVQALYAMATWVRDLVNPQVVAITGSNGKTTTKDFVAAVLATGWRTVKSPGNANGTVGVPATLCRLEESTEILVVEVGARGPGRIAKRMPLVRPNVAVVTTISPAHMEFFGTISGVAATKAELVDGLSSDGTAVLNADDPRVAAIAERAPGRVVTYGTSQDAQWRAENIELDHLCRPRFLVRGVEVSLSLPGKHNVGNALAALAVAEIFDVQLDQAAAALGAAAVSPWRMELSCTASGVTVINDSFNASPASMEAALRTLAEMRVTGRRWAVLGLMGEMGTDSRTAHSHIGELIANLGIDRLVVVGDPDHADVKALIESSGMGGFEPNVEAATALLRSEVRAGDAVLVKASRGIGLESIAASLGSSKEH